MSANHYVVLEGLEDGKSSEYTIQTTGNIEMVDGTLGGVSVVKDEDLDINGSSVSTTVWSKADGYRVYGGLKSIDVDSPDNVNVHVGTLGTGDGRTGECEVEIRAKSVEFLEGQGAGEGALELKIKHNVHGAQSVQTPRTRLPVGSSVNLNDVVDSFNIPEGQSVTKKLTTKVTEKDDLARDWFTGQDDTGDDTMDITLECGNPKEVSQTVDIGSDRDNPGKVRVNYVIGDLRG